MVEQNRKNKALDIYPLSPLQEGMLFHHLHHDGAGDHVTQGILPLTGQVDVQRLQQAFQQLIDRHDVLRTVFLHDDVKKPRQVVVAGRSARVRYFDLTAKSGCDWHSGLLHAEEQVTYAKCAADAVEAIVGVIADHDQSSAFDLKKDLLVRMTLVRTGSAGYQLIITNHHIILDGWSLSVLLEELIECYWALTTGKTPDLAPAVQFKNYIKWVAESDLEAGYGYFTKTLEGFGNPTGIARRDWYSTSRDRLAREPAAAKLESYAGVDFDFGEEKTAALERICRDQQITINTAIQGLWALVLKCFNNRDDIVFGNVVSGRSPEIRGVERMVGLMINTLPLRVKLQEEIPFMTLAQALQKNSKMLEKHSYLQLADIQKKVRQNEVLFDHIVTFENYPITEEMFTGKYAAIGFVIASKSGRDLTSYELNVTFFPGRSLTLNLWYNTALYSEQTMVSVARTLDHLMGQLISRPDIRLNEFSWVSPATDREDSSRPPVAINPALAARIAALIKSGAITSANVRDHQGRVTPIGALGLLWESQSAALPFTAIRQADEDVETVLVVGDNQRLIEVRGFVFPPELIENSVLTDSAVDACALLDEGGDARPTLYWTAREPTETAAALERVKAQLAVRFPHFMLPGTYQPARSIAYGESAVSVARLEQGTAAPSAAAPVDEVEAIMADLWKEMLGVDTIEPGDDFFLKGGHSLTVIRFTSRAKKLFAHPPTTADMFGIRTFGGLVAKVRANAGKAVSASSAGFTAVPLVSAPVKPFYGASSQQQRLFSLQALDPESLAYNMPDAFILRGPINTGLLANAFASTIAKHESLRTSFHLEQNSVVQRVHPKAECELQIENVAEAESPVQLLDAFVRPFRLDRPALVRAKLCVQSAEQGILLLDMHHIVTDGVSIEILVKDLVAAYHQQQLQPARFQYKDFCEWQQHPRVRDLLQEQKRFWLERFNGEIPVLNLPTDFPRRPEFRYTAAQHQFDLGSERSRRIAHFCQLHKVTPYMFFMAVYEVLLARYSNQQEIVVGTPIAGRNHPDTEEIAGMFVNTLAIKEKVDFDQPFAGFLANVKNTLLGALNNQNFPLEELITALNPPRDLSRNALFDVLFLLEDKKQPLPQFDNLSFELVEHRNHSAKFDLLLAILDDPDNYSVHMEFARELFADTTINRMSHHLVAVLDAALADTSVKLGEIELLSDAEIRRQVEEFNHTAAPVGEFFGIAAAFEDVVRRQPGAPAVVFGEEQLSFAELNQQANRIAHWLHERGIGRGSVVALMMTKGAEMISAIYGVLKAGAAYVPVGTDYPQERVQAILDELNVPLLIHNAAVDGTVAELGLSCETSGYDGIQETAAYAQALDDLRLAIELSDLAYVIYTSGSTGKPKGIMIEQRSVLNLAAYFKSVFGPGDRVTQFAPFTFDASAGEILTTLLNGACLHVLPMEILGDPAKYADYLAAQRITFSALPPPYLVNVDFSRATDLHTLLAAGSSSNTEVIEKLKSRLTYINAYGPTETTVISTEWRSDRDAIAKNCIGRPILNTTVYILNNHNRLQPIGVEGEICIGGLGVARGYVKDPAKTAAQFIQNPYRRGETIYRTGDMGRLTENGEIIFLGRRDDQVKIRGFRIEIAEVEQHIKSLAVIADAHVMAFTDKSGNLALCCYFTSDLLDDESLDLETLRHALRQLMPEYMIPAYLVLLKSLPLTANGKVDRKQLPAPELSGSTKKTVAPRTAMEELLVDAWSRVLGSPQIGITDNFFSLGGDSIKAIQIAAYLNSSGYKLDVARVFQNPRIQELAAYVEKSEIRIEQGPVAGTQRPTPIQRWFFEKSFTDPHHWNQSSVLFRERGFDAGLVRATLNKLLEHHDNLRAIPDLAVGVLRLADSLAFAADMPRVECRAVNAPAELVRLGQRVQASIDLSKGPLLRAGLVATEAGDYLLIAIHHLLVDGVSWRILYEDFCAVYESLTAGKEPQLPPKTHAFKQWAEALHVYGESDALLEQRAYWRDLCRPEGLLRLNGDSAGTLADARHLVCEFHGPLTRDLLERAHVAFSTNANDLLLTALARAVGGTFGRSEFLINLEGHGRESVCPGLDISRTVGWFTSAFPVRLVADRQESLERAICFTKETLRAVPDKGIGYGVLRYLTPAGMDPEYGLQNVAPDISFNFLGEFAVDEARSGIRIESLDAGPEMSPRSEALCGLNINGSVSRGRLAFDFEYSPVLVDKNQVEKLIELFRMELEALVRFCCERKQTASTPSDFSAKGLTAADLREILQRFARADIEDIHNLSPLQEGMLYTSLLNAGRGDYNIQNDIVLHGELQRDKLEAAFHLLIARHQALRTAIVHENLSRPRQVILNARELPFSCIDISDLDTQAQQSYIDDLQQEDWRRGFDLAADSLTRAVLLQTAAHEHHLLMFSHHIMMDGWCIGALFGELLEIYRAFVAGQQPLLEKAPEYTDYLHWLQRKSKAGALRYWQKNLAEFTSGGGLPFFANTTASTYALCEEILVIDREKTQQLMQLAAVNGLTLNSVAQAIWALLLAAYTNSNDLIFANVISGRPTDLDHADKTIGLFVNTIPLRVRLDKSRTFRELAAGIQADFKEGDAHGFVGLAEIRAQVSLPATVFDHVFVFENFPVGQFEGAGAVPGLTIEAKSGREQVNYDFNIILAPGDEFAVRFSYNGNVISAADVKRIRSHFRTVFEQLLSGMNATCASINLLDSEDMRAWRLLNDTKVDYDLSRTLVDIIREQALATPQGTAVVFGDVRLSYRELWQTAGAVALHLQRHCGVSKGAVIALVLKRSQHMVLGVLGILRAGCAYLPVDPDLPAERVHYMLENAGVDVIVTDNRDTLPSHLAQDRVVALQEMAENSAVTDAVAESQLPQDSDLAYVLYTSGSTGRPKGVMVEHRAIVNRLLWMIDEFQFSTRDVFLQKTAFTFDVSVFELLVPFMCGGALVLLQPGEEKDPQAIVAAIQKHQVSVIHFVPSMLSGFLHAFDGRINADSLRLCVCSGEALTEAHRDRFYQQLPQTSLSNLYGPTEAAIDVTYQKVEPATPKVSIGTPVANTRCFILDALDRPVPVNVPGELCLAGVQLARGYINNEVLTRERFVTHRSLGERLYRTGDLARLGEDGNIYYLGRTDFQVKIRGYRIELGEIETTLQAQAGIRDALVTAIKLNDGTLALCAYVTCPEELSVADIRQWLAARLPEYMVPAFLVKLAEFPLNASGKVDRKKLPDPLAHVDQGRAEQAPVSEMESIVERVWRQVLVSGANTSGAALSVDRSFEQLGGHSISAIRVCALVSRDLGVNLPVASLYRFANIRELAVYLEELKTLTAASSPSETQPIAALDIQKLDQQVSAAFEQWQLFESALTAEAGGEKVRVFSFSPIQSLHILQKNRLSGGVVDFAYCRDTETLMKAICRFIAEQQLLVGTFSQNAARLWQWSIPATPNVPNIPLLDFSGYIQADLEKAQNELITRVSAFMSKRFAANASGLLPYVMMLVKLGQGRHRLMFGADHLITDATTLDVMQTGITSRYMDLLNPGASRTAMPHGYDRYVAVVRSGPATSPASYETELRGFMKAQQNWLAFYREQGMPRMRNFQFKQRFDVEKHSPAEAALRVFIDLVRAMTDLTHIPLTLVADQRKHLHPGYFQVVGEFLDHVPFLYDAHSDSKQRLAEAQAFIARAAQDKVNFLALAEGQSVSAEWKGMAEALYGDNAHLKLIRFNYQGEDATQLNFSGTTEALDENHLAGILCDVSSWEGELQFSISTNIGIAAGVYERLVVGSEDRADA